MSKYGPELSRPYVLVIDQSPAQLNHWPGEFELTRYFRDRLNALRSGVIEADNAVPKPRGNHLSRSIEKAPLNGRFYILNDSNRLRNRRLLRSLSELPATPACNLSPGSLHSNPFEEHRMSLQHNYIDPAILSLFQYEMSLKGGRISNVK